MIYFAPLEDVSGYVFRNLFNSMFSGVDRYYAPFISAVEKGRNHKRREIEDVLPENNTGIRLIPQILTNSAECFLNTAGILYDMGYREINFNLGCPSKDVVSGGRGSGFLDKPEKLERFFDEIFKGLKETGQDIKVSVKSRIGRRDTENIDKLIGIFNSYPFSEVIIHPRLGKDFYRGVPDMASFRRFYEGLKAPVIYNGDILTIDDIKSIKEEYPALKAVMIGRGFMRDPALAREYKGGEKLSLSELRTFTGELYSKYREKLHTDKYALDKMKELWGWLKENPLFDDRKRLVRGILRSWNNEEYESAVRLALRKDV